MADNRDFVNAFQNEGGAPVYVEDKKLSETASQTAVTATDSVLLKGTDGSYHSIEKASFMTAVKEALGSLIKNDTVSGSSISSVSTLTSGGNIGSTTVSDLASVLGDQYTPLGDEDDLNNIKGNGRYRLNNAVSNKPISGYGRLIVINIADIVLQVVYTDSVVTEPYSYYIRKYANSWNSWKKFTLE